MIVYRYCISWHDPFHDQTQQSINSKTNYENEKKREENEGGQQMWNM